jgi:hypothetical protein
LGAIAIDPPGVFVEPEAWTVPAPMAMMQASTPRISSPLDGVPVLVGP